MNDRLLTAWRTIAHNTDGPPVLQIPRANLAELVDELDRLHRWKAEAIDVLERWNRVADKAPAQLGQRRSDAVANQLEWLTAEMHRKHDDAIHWMSAHDAERAVADQVAEALYWACHELMAEHGLVLRRPGNRWDVALTAHEEARRAG